MFGIIGLIGLLAARADVSRITIEPETGTITAPAVSLDDSNASNGKAIKFGGPVIRNLNDKGYGFSVNPFSLSSSQQDTMLDEMNDLGMTWIRFDMQWSGVQATRNSAYNWTKYDDFITKTQAHGIKDLAIIDFSTSWASLPSCNTTQMCEVNDPADYVTYAKSLAQHFGNKLGAVELWNEPNTSGFWKPAPNPTKYAAMATGAYAAIKSVNPTMLVLSAGLAPAATVNGSSYSEPDFLAAVYAAANGVPFADAIGAHPYSYPAPASQYFPWSGWSKLSQTPTSLRSVMAAHDDSSKSIWATEVGIATNGPKGQDTCAIITAKDYYTTSLDHADDCAQSKILTDAITIGRSYPFMGPIFLYTYKDLGTDTSTAENFFGLVNLDGSHKASYDAVKQAIAAH